MENKMQLEVDQKLLSIIIMGIDELPIKVAEKAKAEIVRQVMAYNKTTNDTVQQ